jgi:rod shape-determining protein MreD
MNQLNLIRAGRLVLLLALQISIFNQIHIGGYVTPLLIGYMLVCFQNDVSRTGLLVWGFLTGFLFDMFSNTAGMASASCTLLAMMQPKLLKLFSTFDPNEIFAPNIQSMGLWRYLTYVFFCMLVLHTAFYALDAFTLQNWPLTLIAIGGSTAMATLLCLFSEMFVRRRK